MAWNEFHATWKILVKPRKHYLSVERFRIKQVFQAVYSLLAGKTECQQMARPLIPTAPFPGLVTGS